MKRNLLIVDDNNALREALKMVFEDDFDLTFASSGEEALLQYTRRSPEVVLMDYKMPGMDGIETLQRLRAHNPESRVVLMSAYCELPTVIQAMRQGATDFIGKPFSIDQIKQAVCQATDNQPAAAPQSPKTCAKTSTPYVTQREVDDMIRSTLRVASL